MKSAWGRRGREKEYQNKTAAASKRPKGVKCGIVIRCSRCANNLADGCNGNPRRISTVQTRKSAEHRQVFSPEPVGKCKAQIQTAAITVCLNCVVPTGAADGYRGQCHVRRRSAHLRAVCGLVSTGRSNHFDRRPHRSIFKAVLTALPIIGLSKADLGQEMTSAPITFVNAFCCKPYSFFDSRIHWY